MFIKRLNVALIGLGRMGKIHIGHLLYQIPDKSVIAAANAVVIATPTNTHAALVEEVLNAGNQLFCEKPLDFLLSTTEALTEKMQTAGAKDNLAATRLAYAAKLSLEKQRPVSMAEIGAQKEPVA